MLESPIAFARKFETDERGGVMIMFGLTTVILCTMVGLAFDVGRAVSTKSRLANAADAAALAAAKGIRLEGMTDDQAIAAATLVFNQNMASGAGRWTTINSLTVTIDRARGRAIVDVDSAVKTTFANVVGIDKMQLPGAASAQFDSRDVEVGVQLDLTGSMCSPCQKLDDLKAATKDLVDILIPSTPTVQKVRVGFAPFSAGVNVQPYLTTVTGRATSTTNCVYERQDPSLDASDDAPDPILGTGYYKAKEDLAGTVQKCPDAGIVPLTDARQVLKDHVDTFQARSSTAGQLGASWAWNLVSPKWKDIWPLESRPVEYGNADTDKVVILMTDGVYNTIGGQHFGDNSFEAETASTKSVELCTAMKAQGITIYTVGFDFASINSSTARTRAENTLRACAGRQGTDHVGYFYEAENGLTLRAAFNNIATSIMRLRLTN